MRQVQPSRSSSLPGTPECLSIPHPLRTGSPRQSQRRVVFYAVDSPVLFGGTFGTGRDLGGIRDARAGLLSRAVCACSQRNGPSTANTLGDHGPLNAVIPRMCVRRPGGQRASCHPHHAAVPTLDAIHPRASHNNHNVINHSETVCWVSCGCRLQTDNYGFVSAVCERSREAVALVVRGRVNRWVPTLCIGCYHAMR